MSADDPTTWVEELIAAFNAHDARRIGEFFTDDAEYSSWTETEWVKISGRNAIVELLESFDRDFSSDFALEKTFAVVTEHGFAVEYEETGTQDRGSNASGRRFFLRNVMVGELRAGKISRMTDYSDVTAYRMQMLAD